MKPLTLTLIAALLILGCAGEDPATARAGAMERTSWWLSEPPDGRSLELLVSAGNSGCFTYDHVETNETEDSVEVRAYVLYNAEGACTDDSALQRVRVRLNEAVGDRKLEGCGGPAVKWDLQDRSDGCRVVRQEDEF